MSGQRALLAVFAFAVAGLCLFPPWIARYQLGAGRIATTRQIGHALLFRPPDALAVAIAWQSQLSWGAPGLLAPTLPTPPPSVIPNSAVRLAQVIEIRLDIATLLLELGVLLAVLGGTIGLSFVRLPQLRIPKFGIPNWVLRKNPSTSVSSSLPPKQTAQQRVEPASVESSRESPSGPASSANLEEEYRYTLRELEALRHNHRMLIAKRDELANEKSKLQRKLAEMEANKREIGQAGAHQVTAETARDWEGDYRYAAQELAALTHNRRTLVRERDQLADEKARLEKKLERSEEDRDSLRRSVEDLTAQVDSRTSKMESYKKGMEILREAGGRPPLPFEVFKHLVVIGAYYYEGGIRDCEEWTKKMVSEHGEHCRPYLPRVYDEASFIVETGRIPEYLKDVIKDPVQCNEPARPSEDTLPRPSVREQVLKYLEVNRKFKEFYEIKDTDRKPS